jgi:YVTN family beta-propeller protein
MEFHILGPLEVTDEGEALPLGGSKQRALIALLLLRPNEPVSVDRIVDELWGERPPPTAPKNVQVYVSHLRKVLGETTIATTPAGYALRVAEGSVDAQRAEDALALAKGKAAAEQAELLRAALALWRGPPFGELADLPSARAEIVRLEELRLHLLKRRIEAELELGRHEDLVPELEKLVAAHPLDERLRAQLMLALYQSGRQAEALAVYRDARRTLDEELGLEPDEELRALEQRILAHDPALRPPAPVPGSARGGRDRAARVRSLPRSVLVGAALIGAAALFAAVVALARDEPEAALAVAVPANAIAVVDAVGGSVVAAIPVGRGPESVVAGAGAVWVANVGDRTLSRIDPKTLRVTKTVGLGFEPTDLAADNAHVWVAGGFDHALWRVDRDGVVRLKTTFAERLPLPGGFERGVAGVAVAPGAVWLSHGDEVTELDPTTGAVRRTVAAGGRWQREVAVVGRAVWAGVNGSRTPRTGLGLDRFDAARDGRVRFQKLISEPSEILVESDRVWVAVRFGSAIWELSPETGELQRTIPAGYHPEGLAFYDESVWISNEVEATVRQVDARTGDTQRVIPIGHALEGVAVAEGRLFVAVRGP